MDYRRIFACLMCAASVMALSACGDKSGESSETAEIALEDDMEVSEEAQTSDAKETEETTVTEETVTTEISSMTESETGTETTAVTTSAPKDGTTATHSSAKSGGGNTIIYNNNSNSNQNSGGGAKTTTNATAKATTKATTKSVTTTTTTEPVSPEDVDKYIDFAAAGAGDGYTYDGRVLNIFSPGTYHVSGTLYGMIYVNAGSEDKIKIRLEGAGIENTGAPCIQIDNADRVTVHAAAGSSNYLNCSGTDAKNDAALFSKDDLRIKGEGSLYISCDNEHGISCNNDLEIEKCQLTVDAEKIGINSHKSIKITSGVINTNGDNCGIRCRDRIEINDGFVQACGGKKAGADRGGIISDTGALYIGGGTVIALGMNNTIPVSGQVSAVFTFPEAVAKENPVGISVAGVSVADAVPNKKYSTVLISSPQLYQGAVCDVWLAGTYYDNFQLTGAVTQAALDGVH